VRQIRALPGANKTPIVMFTAYGNGDYKRKAIDVGANSLLHKPILPQDLLSHLSQLACQLGK
jgi:CheY-like chemotaxis protein